MCLRYWVFFLTGISLCESGGTGSPMLRVGGFWASESCEPSSDGPQYDPAVSTKELTANCVEFSNIILRPRASTHQSSLSVIGPLDRKP